MKPEDTEGPDSPLSDLDDTILSGVRELWEAADPMPPGSVLGPGSTKA